MSTLLTFEDPTSLTTFFADSSDADLVARAKAGEAGCFEALYSRHLEAVTDVCSARLRQPDLVQDAVQETFARALEALPTFQGGALIAHWLTTVAKHVSTDVLRNGTRVPLPHHLEAQLADHHAEAPFTRCVDRHAVEAVLERLDARDRDMLVAHHMHQEPLATTAQRWSVTPGSAAVMLHRARGKARRSARFQGLGLVFLPLAPLRRLLRQLRDRVAGGEGTALTMFNVTTAQLVVAVALAVPAVASAESLTPEGERSSSALTAPPVVVEVQAPPAPQIAAPQPPAQAPPPSVTQPAGGPAVPPSEAVTSTSQPAPVPLPPVEVEAVDVRVHQEAPADPDYTYGVDSPLLADAEPGVVTKDEPEAEPVHAAACVVAGLSEPLTYCHQSSP